VVDPTTDPTLDPTYTIDSDAAPQAAELAAPVITLKQGDAPIVSGAKVPNGAANVTFEIKAADGTEGTPEFYYNIDGTANPTNENGTKYENTVSVTAPTETTEKTVTIKAIAYIPASGEGETAVAAQTSAVATATVVFQEKGKNISLSGESEAATIKIGETTLSADASYEIEDTENDLYVEVTATGDNAKKLFEVMYKDGPDTSSSTWTSANEETSGDNKGKYKIPKTRLTKDLVLKVVYMREITLNWQGDANWDSIGITAKATRSGSSRNEVIFGDRLKDEKPELANKVLAPKDTKVTLSIYPVTGAKITLDEVTLKEGEKEAQAQTIRNNKADFTVTDSIATDYTVTIKGTGSYQGAVLKDSEENRVSAVSGKYSVEPRKTYKLSAEKAGGAQYDIGAVKILEGSKDVTSDSDIVILTANTKTVADGEDGTETQAEVPDGTWNLALKEGAGGKNLKVMLYTNEGDAKEAGFINLTVTPVISSVTVAKATGTDKDTIKQIVGTEGHYALTLNAKEKTSKDVLEAVVKADTNTTNLIKSVGITAGNKELVITTNAVEVTNSAVEVEIRNKNNDEATAVIKTIKVVPDKPAWDNKTAPTVKLAGATDIALNLDMTLPNGASETVDGATYFYRVTTKAADTTKKDYTADDTARYYKATGKTTHGNIKVIAQDFGKGRSEKFSATVELVLYKNPGGTVTPPTGGGGNEGSGEGTGGGGETTASASVNAAADETGGGTGDGDTGDGGDGEGGTTPGQPEAPDTSDAEHTETPESKGYTKIATSKFVTLNNLATKAVYYADKITLKKEKAASGIYTGQTAAVATVDFGKNTTYNRDRDVKAWVKEYKDATDNDDNIIKVEETDGLTVKGGKVTLIVGKDVKPGKYTLCVEQTAGTDQGIPDWSVQASATMPITVVKGIKTIEASSASTIYVQANKPGTAKITTVYNGGIAADKPKTAKVDYEIGKVENDSFTKVADYNTTVSVKNGSVTVAKGYKDGDFPNNKFAVKVYAVDFDGNTAADYVEYEIVTEAQKLGNIVLVQKEATSTAAEGDEDTSTYKVLEATNGKIEIPEDQAKKTYVRILAGEKTETTGLKEADFVKASLYTLTFSKKNDVSVNKDQSLAAKKVVSDVTVKALTTDGGKQKAANDGKLKFSIVYENVAKENVKLQIATANSYEDFDTGNTKAVDTPTGAQIKVKAVEIVGELTNDLSRRLVDYKVTVDGGATIVNNNGNKDNLDITLVMKKNKAVLTLKTQKNAKIADYTITNDNFSKLKAAPVVSLAKNEKLHAKYEAEQTLEFTVAKWDTKKVCDNTAVKKIKVTAAADKDSQALYMLIKSESKEQEFTPTANGTSTFKIAFDSMAKADAIKKATLYFDFVDESGAAQTLTTKGTVVKSELLKKSYKLTNKYSMSVKDAAKVTLTASGKPVGVAKKADSKALDVTFEKILNANIKGEVNRFREAFKLDEQNSQLILIDPEKAVKDYGKKDKYKGINNLIGFVVYTVNYEDGTKDTFTTQLTITIDAKKPAINGLKTTTQPVLAATDMAPEFSVITNKKVPVKLVAATFEGKNGGEIFELGKVDTENGIVTLKLGGENSAAPTTYKKLDGTLTVLPADSYYVKSYNEAQEEADKTKILKEKGVALAVKIDVKDPAKTTKLVKLDSKQAKVSFENTKADEQGKYTGTATYTVAVSASVKGIANGAPDKNNKPTCPNWITFSTGAGKNEISIVIDQKAYAAAVKGDGTQLNAKKDNYKDAGKAVKAVAVVSYNGSEKTDSLTFTITPPTMTKAEIDAAAGESPAPGEDTITVTVTPATTTVNKGKTATFTASVTGSTEQNPSVTWKVEAAQDGGIMTQSTSIDASGKLTVDKSETATKLTVTATYTDAGSSKAYTGTATVTVGEDETQNPTE
ncbi:MAG: hypothetical protein K2H37_15220, partial [Lachnospiraceae bacterium]|nr:hypothetical protein [Lachnospiraceae bacterium]